MENWSHPDDVFFDVNKSASQNHSPHPQPYHVHSGNVSNSAIVPSSMPVMSNPPYDDTLQQLKVGFSKMMSILERLEQRVSKVEQTTQQILKNQQEVLQVPFMSQAEIDNARKVAEQLEQDTSVAKQLQAAYNKEIEVKKNMNSYSMRMSHPVMMAAECPICGVRVSQMDLEVHVDNCLDMLSNDPKKEVEYKNVQKKMEDNSGFFSKWLTKKTKTETTTTKVVSNQPSSATAPLLSDYDGTMPPHGMYPTFGGYPAPYGQPHNGMNVPPMMMPMYMYPPNYPSGQVPLHE